MNDFHDYEIVSVSVNREARCLDVSMVDEHQLKKSTIQISGVTRLMIEGFGLQNVVLDVTCFTAADTSFEFGRACALLSLDPQDAFAGDARFLTFIQASVGAEIACLSANAPSELP